ncbi:MAG: fumarate hydratase [archaeon]|jgi:fumarate hydratase subunit alpha
MREINSIEITKAIKGLCLAANCKLGNDVKQALENAQEIEISPIGKNTLNQIIANYKIAETENIAICQDTGMIVVFIDIGQDVHISGNLEDAINQGIRESYKDGYFRNSVVKDPITRENTNDNTPAIIHYNIVPGENIKIIVAPKGFGSENMSKIKMLKPSDGVTGITDFVIETIDTAGSNPCPPIVVGVGIGGTMEKASILAKFAAVRSINTYNPEKHIETLEKELLEKINKLGIGPMGLGGRITALKVNIETFPTHIAGLPVAVNINCHATRHAEIIL